MNLGSNAETEGTGHGRQKWSGEVRMPWTRRRTISRGRSSSIRGIRELTVTILTGLSAALDRS